MAQGWEPVANRDSFELEIDPPAPPRRRALLNRRYIAIVAAALLILFLYFTTSQYGESSSSQEEKATSNEAIPQTSAYVDPSSTSDSLQQASTSQLLTTSQTALPTTTSPIALSTSTTSSLPSPSNNPVNVQPPTNPYQLSTTKAAVIIENRSLSSLVPIILHFSAVLGPDWPIHIFTNGSNSELFATSPAIQRNIRDGRFRVRSLLPDQNLDSHAAVSDFFTKPWFWEQMTPAEHILLFQADSIICSNSPSKVEYFMEYDFVGGPVDTERGLGMGYNGGLSLRNRTMCEDITRRFSWQEERHGDHSEGNVDYEDQWFSKKMREIGANLPSTEVAMEFSVETMWYDQPLGYHQPFVWQKERMNEIREWCPEIAMCTNEVFKDHNTENFGSGND